MDKIRSHETKAMMKLIKSHNAPFEFRIKAFKRLQELGERIIIFDPTGELTAAFQKGGISIEPARS